jgi:hypothetical protein
MPTPDELLRVIRPALFVSTLVAALGHWRGWAWAMPVAAGAGFITSYALLGIPKLPPRDGTDWLFWVAIPVTLLGVVDAMVGGRWGWVLGAAAGGAMLVIVRPLAPDAVSMGELLGMTMALAGVGALLCLGARFAEWRIGAPAIVAALCITLGGAAVVVLSSNLRIVGIYGIALSAGLGPVAVLAGDHLRAGRSVAVVAIPLLAGLLAAGRYYADPGVSWSNFAVLMLAPALLPLSALPPGKRVWIRGVLAVVAVAITVAAVTMPTVLAAKKAAESTANDPYAGY